MIKSAYIEWHEARMRDLEVAAKLSLERARHLSVRAPAPPQTHINSSGHCNKRVMTT